MQPTSRPRRAYIAHRRESDGAIQSLEDHLHGVGQLARRFASKFALDERDGPARRSLEPAGEVLGLLHDLGKYSDQFQNYLSSATGLIHQDADGFVDAVAMRGRIDHSTAGAQYLWGHLSDNSVPNMLAGQALALCIASHHCGLIDCVAPDGTDDFTRRMSKGETAAHLSEAFSRLDASIAERVSSLVAGGTVPVVIEQAFRRIAVRESSSGRSDVVVQFKFGLLIRFLFSCLIDADRVDTADFERPSAAALRHRGHYPDWGRLANRLESHLAGLANRGAVDELRRETSLHCRAAADRNRGLFTLTVPTGGGKTLASLRFALHHAKRHSLERVIYVVPFTSIIDQNADVVRAVLERDEDSANGSIVLEHHSNLTPDEQTWRAKVLAENWDAPVVFTTTVQLLEALFGSGTRGARRMHQLARAVIIFDEAQAVPLRCIHIFNNAINFLVEHCGSSVVLCTATQPRLASVCSAKGAARYDGTAELVPDVPALFEGLRRTEIRHSERPGGWPEADVAALAAEEIRQSGSCLVIVNTRKSALALFEVCTRQLSMQVHHLSTMMCPAHRRAVLATVRAQLASGVPVLCVSTQLIEAGVDVDFGAVIRYVAGLDSIAQAAGRCNRNGVREIGRVHVINPATERIDRLLDIRFGRDVAQRVLTEYSNDPAAFDGDVLGPKALSRFFDYYFAQRSDEMDYPVSPGEASRTDTILNMLSGNRLAVSAYEDLHEKPPPAPFRQAFMTAAKAFRAIDAPTQGVIVPYGDEGQELVASLAGAFEPASQFKLLNRAQQFSVNLFPQTFSLLLETGALSEIGEDTGIFHLRPEHYHDRFGLSETPTSPMETLHA